MTGNTDRERVKRSILISAAVAALVGVFALGWYTITGVDKPKDGPRVTVGKYMKAIRTKHVKDAQALLCSGLAKDKQDVADRAERFRRLNYRVGGSTKTSDTEYRVDVKLINSIVNVSGKDIPTDTTYVFKVVKEHGNWLVCGITT